MENEMILTPCSNTPVLKKGRWKNELYVREYHRLKQRAKNPPKQRVRVCEDGTLFRERNPEKVVPYYLKKPKQYCDVCGMDVFVGRLPKHRQSVLHTKNLQAYERGQKAVIIEDNLQNPPVSVLRMLPIFCNSI